MFLERLQVEEGFLSGLDVSFTSGLNVVIGARGTGKTSLIELIRYCLDAQGAMQDSAKKSREHALSILGSGQVTATIHTGGQRVTISRTASDSTPRASGVYRKPIVFSQTEIETIGLEPAGRLRLIDGFIPIQHSDDTEERKVIAMIASLTTEAINIRKELDEIESALKNSAAVDAELKEITSQEAAVASGSSVLQEKSLVLQNLSEKISAAAIQESTTSRAQTAIYSWYEKIKLALDFTIFEESDTASRLAAHVPDITASKESLQKAHDLVAKIWHSLESDKKNIASIKLQDEAIARESRVTLESLQAGAGLVMRKGQELREKKARLNSMESILNNKKDILNKITQKRSGEFDRLETIRFSRFSEREKIVQKLNSSLGPSIRLTIRRNGQQAKFASLIADMLRGSGVRYSDVAPMLAASVSPRTLLEAIEDFDVPLISESSGVAQDRTARVLSHLRSTDLGALGTIDLEDEVSMQLLDGVDYKDISMLSTGQRCTVILPIVLAHTERIVIVDQPEDHIDNAFITSTLIRAVLSRDPFGQILFSTHNPNIPVLGNADTVIHLASDGKRGYVVAKGELNNESVVESISTVMEGGAEAFSKRSVFYGQYIS